MSEIVASASGEMSSSREVVGTYNMSWASDSSDDMAKLKTSASEYSFLLKNKGTQRAFWENAKTHLQNFITEKKPIAVGLQEMNVTEDGIATGTGAIKAILPEGYTIVSETVESKFGSIASEAIRGKKNADVGISIIIDTTRTGPVIKEQVLDNDKQTGFVDGGRPLLMVLTEKGYLFVNMHGAQNPGLGKDKTKFNEYMVTNNRDVLQTKVSEFISGQTVQTIYVMGDFNDRYDAITEFTIDGKSVKYDGDSPKSCCHNWDSSSVEGRRAELGDGYFYGKEPTIDLYKNNFPNDKFDIKSEIPDEDVKIKNYLYKGDKVFSNKNGKLLMFNSDLENVSDKSDHELVYFEETLAGGRRKSKRKQRRSRKQKKSRKQRR